MITSGGKSFVSTSAKTALLNSNENRRTTNTEPTQVFQDHDDSQGAVEIGTKTAKNTVSPY